jgi:hypothetical protein
LETNGLFYLFAGDPYKPKFSLNTSSVLDGLSNTLLFGEKHIANEQYGVRTAGDGSTYNGDHGAAQRKAGSPNAPLAKGPKGSGQFGSYHPGVCPFALADGSVRLLSVSIELKNLGRLANRKDGEVITVNF